MFHLQAACLVLGLKPFSYGQEGKFPDEKHKLRPKVCAVISQVQRTDTYYYYFFWTRGILLQSPGGEYRV